MTARGLLAAALIVGISVIITAVIVGLVFLCVALLGGLWGGVVVIAIVCLALFAVIAWVSS